MKETDLVSETFFSSYLEFRTIDKVHQPSDSVYWMILGPVSEVSSI
jgi:hypothetical protein